MENKEIKQLEEKLTDKNFKFIEALSKGLKVHEAYKLAGYKGKNKQQPYQLMHKLKGKIQEYLENNGFNKSRVAIELEKLLSLPLRDTEKEVTIDQRLRMIGLLNKSLPEVEKKSQNFTRFTIIDNRVNSGQMDNAIDPKKVVELDESENVSEEA